MGIDYLNTNYHSSALPIGKLNPQTGLNTYCAVSAFDNYFSPPNPFSSSSFADMDFMSIMMQQQSFLTMLFANSPTSFDLGLPEFNKGSSENMDKKISSMKLSKEACKQIDEMSKRLNMSSKDLKGLIYSESGGNPQAVNKHSGATGLIQFMPKTAAALGTSTEALKRMTAEQQLPYVEKYLKMSKKNAGFDANHQLSAGELYALVFMPAKAKKEVLCSSGTKAYSLNRGLDRNRDGRITITELGSRIA